MFLKIACVQCYFKTHGIDLIDHMSDNVSYFLRVSGDCNIVSK